MNNIFYGNERYQNYDTVCGGTGAGPDHPGTSAVHSHMTNTRMTDPEVLESRFPVSKIWRLGRDETEPDAPIEVEGGPEWLMVIRPDAEVEVRTLSEAGYHFGFALSKGLALGEAWETACRLDPSFDLQGHLAGFFAGGTFTDYRLAPDTSNSDDGDPS